MGFALFGAVGKVGRIKNRIVNLRLKCTPQKYARAVDKLVSEGYLLPEDGAKLKGHCVFPDRVELAIYFCSPCPLP
jgi:hypothetical protein